MQLNFKKSKAPKQALIDIDDFKGGTNHLVDEARLGEKYATESMNLIQVQDGLWKTRWGFNYYGEALADEDTIDGGCEYVPSSGDRELIVVGGTTGKIYKSTDGGSWEQIDTDTLTPGETPFFLQIGGELYIANGTDNLLRYDGTDLNEYSALDAPDWAATPLARGAGLSSGSYTCYYRVTAINDVGETEAAAEESITVDIPRDQWSAADEYITVDWDSVTGANRYNIYYSDEAGQEVLLTSVTVTEYEDDGSAAENVYIAVPDADTTSAPLFTHMENSGNRIWATGDTANEYRVYWSGTGANQGSFNPFYGGGWVDLEKGGRDKPKAVVHYRTGGGTPRATVLCSSPEGQGSIWQIEIDSVTVGNDVYDIPSTYKVVGSIGTDSPKSVTKVHDNIMFANKRGVFALRNKEQMFNVLSTDEISQAIRPSYRSLKPAKVADTCSYYYEGKVFFSAAEGSENDIIFIFDAERGNWNWKWTRGVADFLEYTDSDDKTHFLGVPEDDDQLWEISENFGGDFGEGFYQSYVSPLIPVDKDRTTQMKAKYALIELGRPSGEVDFAITGLEAGHGFSNLGDTTVTSESSETGWSWDKWSEFMWGGYVVSGVTDGSTETEVTGTPKTYSQASVKRVVKLNKRLYAIQFKVSTTTAQTNFTILNLQAKGTKIPKRAPSDWRA